ncbi:MAG: pyridoxal phosphate-dependent aminotransferase [Methanomassiliicoccaceae archaeon]|jgi:aspartate aminotransferase|nr:pyridoxal phosphate-dependent aminotransferase [Methanomassiliicoccaceae archaeon]
MVSKRLMDVPESGTVAIANLVSQLKHDGVNIVSFSMGEPDFDTPDNIKQACVRSLNDGFTHYTPSTGIPELRKAIAETTAFNNKIKCTAKNVLVTPTKQALFMIALAYLDPGDEVILPDPAWVSYEAVIRLAGAKAVYVPTRFEDNFRITADMVASVITPRTKMLILNSPSNPTGSVLPRKTLKGIADLCIDRNIMVLSDEIYEHIIYEGEHVSIASFDGMFDRTFTISGLSKTYAMTGWRLGWLVAPEKIIAAVNKLQTHSITCCTSFTQPAAVEALKGPQDSRKRMVTEFRKRRDLALDLLSEIKGLECNRPEGAFYLFPRYDHKMLSDDLAMHLMKEAHVAITPGRSFGPAGENHFRLSYATSEKNITEGIGSMKRAFSKL